jgi:hypothetical protein
MPLKLFLLSVLHLTLWGGLGTYADEDQAALPRQRAVPVVKEGTAIEASKQGPRR